MKHKNGIRKALSFLMFTLFFVAVSTGVYAQQKTVTGKIVDDEKQPLPGVTVVVKGTTQGSVTDFDGNYSITGVSPESVLTISFVGMLTQHVAVGSQSSINITMKTDAVGLEEVIVVGYGTQSNATLSGAVEQVKGEKLMKGKGTSSAALAMQGEVPGLTITRTSSRPGNEDFNIKIRGDISVNDIDPLILLDGMEIPQWQLSTLNSGDIETMSVLKDGAAAIYGTKAAGGVILITTKKGKKGELKVEYNGDIQFKTAKSWPMASLQEWGQLWLEVEKTDRLQFVDADGATQTAGSTLKFFDLEQYQKIAAGEIPTDDLFNAFDFNYADTDYFDAIYGTTMSQMHNVAISGGSEKATFRTSLGFADERSAMDVAYDGAKKYNFRTNLTYQVNDIISTDFNVSYDNRVISSPSDGVGQMLQDPWIFELKNPDGQYYHLWGGGQNILAALDEGGTTETIQEVFRLGGTINFNLDKYVKGLSFRYNGNVSSRSSDKTTRNTTQTVYNWDGSASITNPALPSTSVKLDIDNVLFQNHVIQGMYKRSFGDHNLTLMAGVTAEKTQSDSYDLYRKNMATDELDALDTGDATTQTNGGTSDAVSLLSYIGKLNYDYKGIYLLEASGRRDGSSRLDPDYRWKNFFGASAGVRLSELGAVKDLDIFDNLKVRVSYGETGSVTGIGKYDYYSTISTGETYFGAVPGLANAAWIASMTTTDRSWERVGKTNFGLNFAVLDSRLSGTFDYFMHQNKDMLISITYPEVLGASAPKTNSGDFKTHGYELALNWRDQVGEIRYNVGLSFWDSKTEVTRMEGASQITHGVNGPLKSKTTVVEGQPLNVIYAYKTDGLFQNEDEVLDYYNTYHFADASDQLTGKSGSDIPDYRSGNRLSPGSYRKVDLSGDGVINEDDLYAFGDANPHYSFGINLGLEWKNFDFSAFFQGVGQQYINREGTLAYPFRAWYQNQNKSWLGETWSVDNTGADFPAITNNGQRRTWNYGVTNDNNIIKARYMRAKIISLGYTLPQGVVDGMGIDRMRLAVTGNDLFTISNISDGLDPENDAAASNGSVEPFNRSFMFSVQVTF